MKKRLVAVIGILAAVIIPSCSNPTKVSAIQPTPEVLSTCHTGSGTYRGYPYWGSECDNGTGVQRAEMHTVFGELIYGPCVGQDAWSNAISWSGAPVAWARIDHGC